MNSRTQENIALAKIVAQMLWLNGLITTKEREIINKNSQKILQN